MKKSRFSEEQIIAILQQAEGGVSTADVCREHGVSSATFYIYGWLSLCKRSEVMPFVTGADIYPASPVDIGAPKWVIREAWPSTNGRPLRPS